MINIDIGGIDRLNRNIAAMRPLFVQAARATVADAMLFSEVAIADHIDRYDAIDTGRLKGSIAAHTAFEPKDTAADLREIRGAEGVERVEGVVGTNVHYAIPVHEGYTTSTGRHIDGRPFMADAVPEIETHLEKTAREMFGSLLR